MVHWRMLIYDPDPASYLKYRKFLHIKRLKIICRMTKPTPEQPTSFRQDGMNLAVGTRPKSKNKNHTNTIKLDI